MKPTLLVMAAGMGSRYGGLKQVDPVGPGGERLLDYSVFDAVRAGFGRAVFVIRRHMADAFTEGVLSRFAGRMPTACVFQELDDLPAGFARPAHREKPWGTGHAVLVAREAVDGPFAVINADDFYGADAFRTLGRWLAEAREGPRGRFSMVGFRLDMTLSEHGSVARGICRVDAGGRLLSVEETLGIAKTADGARCAIDGRERRFDGTEPVSMNMWGFTPALFDALQERFAAFLERRGQEPKSEFFIPDVVNALLAADKVDVQVLPTSGAWFGVTYREDKPVVERAIRRLIAAGVYPERLWD